VSQKKRKLVEEAFGWMKTVGLLHKLRHRGPGQGPVGLPVHGGRLHLVRMRSLLGDCAAG